MAPQTNLHPSSLNQSELQREFERLFGEVERMLGNASATERETPAPANHWAYPPSALEIDPEETVC